MRSKKNGNSFNLVINIDMGKIGNADIIDVLGEAFKIQWAVCSNQPVKNLMTLLKIG